MIIASIDIGTNTVLMLIARYHPDNSEIVPIQNFQRIPRIGRDLSRDGTISQESVENLIQILREYKLHAENLGASKILVSGTNALRIAFNAESVIKRVKENTGLSIDVITPLDEALFSYLGSVGGIADECNSLVVDIGGGSTELIIGRGKNVLISKSHLIGVVSLKDNFFLNPPLKRDDLYSAIERIDAIIDKNIFYQYLPAKAIAIAGTPTTLASIAKNIPDTLEEEIDGSVLNIEELRRLRIRLGEMTPEQILNNFKISRGREDVIFAGTLLLERIMELLEIDQITVSTRGLRYGAIEYYRFMNAGKYFAK